MPAAIFALAVATFAIGTTEFVIVGLLPNIATDLHVSIPTAGLLVSLYALAITLGTPIVSAMTGGLPRRNLAIALMVVFAATNLSAALAPNYSALLASRIVMAVAHGVFFGVGAACATSLVSKSRAGSAVAAMMGGLTIAMVIGVPLGSWIGQLFNWRTPFLIVTALATVAVLGLVWLLPREISYSRPAPFLSQLSLLETGTLRACICSPQSPSAALSSSSPLYHRSSPTSPVCPRDRQHRFVDLWRGIVRRQFCGRTPERSAWHAQGDDDRAVWPDRLVRLHSARDPQSRCDLRHHRDLGDLRLRDPAYHADRRRGDRRASRARCDRHSVRLQHRGLQLSASQPAPTSVASSCRAPDCWPLPTHRLPWRSSRS